MDLPKIYAHIAPDGRLLEARAEPPVSSVTMGGRVHEYGPLDWVMSDQADFTLPEDGRPVVCKAMTMANGDELSESRRYRVCLRDELNWTRQFWGVWGWRYFEL